MLNNSNNIYETVSTKQYLPNNIYKTVSTKQYLPNSIYQTVSTKQYLPNNIYQTISTKQYLQNNIYQTISTKQYLPNKQSPLILSHRSPKKTMTYDVGNQVWDRLGIGTKMWLGKTG